MTFNKLTLILGAVALLVAVVGLLATVLFALLSPLYGLVALTTLIVGVALGAATVLLVVVASEPEPSTPDGWRKDAEALVLDAGAQLDGGRGVGDPRAAA